MMMVVSTVELGDGDDDVMSWSLWWSSDTDGDDDGHE